MKKYTIVIFSYGKAYLYLKKKFIKKSVNVVKIIGLNFTYENNQFMIKKSIINERKKFNKLITKNLPVYLKYISKYDPFLIITDYEPVSGTIAKFLKIPLITVDNFSFFTRGIVKEVFSKHWQVRLVRNFAGFKGDYNFIVNLFKIPLRKKCKSNTYFIGPIIRKDILNSNPVKKNHILVYQTSKSNLEMFEILKSTSQKYIVYGFEKNAQEQNIIYKKNSIKGFIEDLASCKGIITNGGFSLICEAVHLKKPIYSIPVKNQIEQIINAYYLKKAGFAMTSEKINIVDLKSFLENLIQYEKNLKSFYIEPNNFKLIKEKIRKIEEYPTSKRSKLLKNMDKLDIYMQKKLKKFQK